MKELAEDEIQHASEEREQITDGHATEEENSPALATSSYSVHPAVIKFRINDGDIACLDDGKMLVDPIIEFYLTYIHYEIIPAEFQERTHIFSTFFNTFLCNVFDEKCTVSWLDVKRRFFGWTKNVDIFSKDFIFVPINWRNHWYLAVICFLTQLPKNSHEAISTESNPTVVENKESSDERHSEYDSQSTKEKNYTFLDKGKPCIFFFDSYDNRTGLGKDKKLFARNFKLFFKMLWLKKNPEKSYDWTSLPCFKAACPQQENDVDCGLYLLQYAESFFQNPIPNFENTMPELKNWFSNSIMTFKRAQITKVISDVKGKQPKAVASASSCSSDLVVLQEVSN